MAVATLAACKSRLADSRGLTFVPVTHPTHSKVSVLIPGNPLGAQNTINQWLYPWQHLSLVLCYPSVRTTDVKIDRCLYIK